MKALVFIPVVVFACGLAGYAMCRATGRDPAVRELVLASLICDSAAEAALVVPLLARRSQAATVAQAALAATVIHMLLTLLFGGLAWAADLIGRSGPFLAWSLVMYWGTLAALVIGVLPLIRQAALREKAQAAANS